MRIARTFKALRKSNRSVALTIGSFDGVHPGHCHLFAQMAKLAPVRLVVTFEILPINYFRKDLNIPQLTTTDEKLKLLDEAGIDTTLLLPFDQATAGLTYKEFLEKIYAKCPFTHLILGKKALLGRDQEGNEERVKRLGDEMGFKARYIEKLFEGGKPISSMRLRKLNT